MVKPCVVKNCPNGRKKKKGKNYKPESVTYFQSTSPARLEIWKKSLGIDLKPKDNICHLHFKEEHIKMYEKYNINGEVKIIPTSRKMLKEEACPTIEHQFVLTPTHEPSILHVRKEDDLYVEHSKDKQHQVQPKITEQKSLLIDQELNNNTNDDANPVLGDAKLIQNIVDGSIESKETPTTRSIDNVSHNTLFPNLPRFWSYEEKPNGYEFMRKDSRSKIKNHIRLNEDLSITVIFPNKEELPLNKKITSTHNIFKYLEAVEKWPICAGAQIRDHKYSESCRGVIIGDDVYERTPQHPRCGPCRILRSNTKSPKSNPTKRNLKRTKKKCECVPEAEDQDIINPTQNSYEDTSKRFSSFSVYLEESFKTISKNQRNIAEKLISDVLFWAKNESLNFDCKIETNSTLPQSSSLHPHVPSECSPSTTTTTTKLMNSDLPQILHSPLCPCPKASKSATSLLRAPQIPQSSNTSPSHNNGKKKFIVPIPNVTNEFQSLKNIESACPPQVLSQMIPPQATSKSETQEQARIIKLSISPLSTCKVFQNTGESSPKVTEGPAGTLLKGLLQQLSTTK